MIVLLTGASGLLGRAVYTALSNNPAIEKVVGTAYSRARDGLVQVLMLLIFDTWRCRNATRQLSPAIRYSFIPLFEWVAIVHCAAERRPDVAATNPDALNVETTRHLASLAKVHNAHFIYISTDYVFDGTHPPYNVDSLPNPLNLYGRTKYQGELAVQQVQAKSCIVRIPVLYGPVEYNGESAINVLVDAVRQTEKRQEMDHYAVRYPTHVQDVASVCNQLVTMENVPSVVHCSAQEAFTKYEMSVLFAEYLNLPTDHLVPVTDAPKGPVDRPHNCHMSIDSLKSAGIHVDFTGFKEWWQNQF